MQKHGIVKKTYFRKLQRHMEDQEMGSTGNISTRAANGGLGVIAEGDETNAGELNTVKNKFNRFERKSIFTIVQMSRDPRYIFL